MTDNTPFFIVGSGRSGTTLLRLILSGHSRIHIPTETHFIADLVRELPLRDPLNTPQLDRAIELITGFRRWPEMEIPAVEFRDWARALEQPSLAEVIDLLYRHHLRIHGKQRWGDKTPDHVHIIPQLGTLYPGAKFIHMIRDGRDVAISFIEVGWGSYCDRRDFEWTRAVHRRREYRASPFAGQILEVSYERLVLDPEATIRRVCVFLGEEFEPAMLDWRGSIDLIPQAHLSTVHGKLLQPMSSDAVELWRKKLSAVECFAVEACLHRELGEVGYALRFSGPAWRPLLAVSGWLLAASAPLLTRAIPYLQRRNFFPRTIYL
jgi:hypothetical protein